MLKFIIGSAAASAAYILFLHQNEYSIMHRVIANDASVPTHPSVLKQTIHHAQQHISLHSSTLIDIGCGNGEALHAWRPHVHKLVGIELDADTATTAMRHCPFARVHNVDMLAYDFSAHADEPLVLYLYEPLWQLSEAKAAQTYGSLIQRVRQQRTSPFFVVYVSSTENHPFVGILCDQQCKLLAHAQMGALLRSRHMFVCSFAV